MEECHYSSLYIFWLHGMWNVGSRFPDQGLNPCHLQWKRGLNHLNLHFVVLGKKS